MLASQLRLFGDVVQDSQGLRIVNILGSLPINLCKHWCVEIAPPRIMLQHAIPELFKFGTGSQDQEHTHFFWVVNQGGKRKFQ